MQITDEKPQIDYVIEAHIRANVHEIEQRERYNGAFETDLNCLQSAEYNSSNLKLELTETGLQLATDWTAEFCFCQLIREDWNRVQ